jgi:hypothetical protein
MTWEEVTAVSTLSLAAVTAGLAWSTRRLAREANAETRANWQPVLVPDPDIGIRMNGDTLELPIRNVGRGPALNVTAALWEEGAEDRFEKVFRGHSIADVVAPGDRIVFQWKNFKAPPPPSLPGINVWSQLEGGISYGDVTYVRYDTELKVGFRADGPVTVLDNRFLGAARDRLTRRQRLRHRALVLVARGTRGPNRGLRRRLARSLARTIAKRLG